MRCFQHRDKDAVGLCRSCGRGACPDCAAEVEGGIACRGRCESEVEATHRYLQTARRSYPLFAPGLRMRAFLWLFMAAGMMFFAAFSHPGAEGVWFFLFLAVVFVLLAAGTMTTARRYAARLAPPRDGKA